MTRIAESISKVSGRRSGTRGYDAAADRERAIKALAARGYNHFVCYRDTASDYALMYGVSEWVGATPYVCR